MDFLVIVGVILWVISAVTKQKNRGSGQKDSPEARAAAAAAAARRKAAAEKAQPAPREPLKPTIQSTLVPREGDPHTEPLAPTVSASRQHAVTPSRESGHAHMETSMTGFSDCPPDGSLPRDPAAQAPLSERLAAFKAAKRVPSAQEPASAAIDLSAGSPVFRFDPTRVRDGLIYAEVLGKPKALQRR